jgi:hypothetical protein
VKEKNMKSFILSSLVLGIVSVVGSASAITINQHGSICNAYYGSEASSINHYSLGTTNSSASVKYVMCDPATEPGPRGFYVDGYNLTAQSFNCYLDSYNYNDTLVASQTQTVPAAVGPWSLYFAVNPIGDYTAIYCYMPGSNNVRIVGIQNFPI